MGKLNVQAQRQPERGGRPDAWRDDVAVVVPCYNEAATIAKVVADFKRALPGARIIVVDNASSDGTGAIAEAAGAFVLTESRRGKGFALLHGFRAARGASYVVMVDGDDTYPAEDAVKLVAAVESGADVAIGTRLADYESGAFRSSHTLGNKLFIGLIRAMFGVKTQDLFSGYRAFTHRFLELSPLIAQGFEVETELSIQALAGGFLVTEIPVRYRARPVESPSKLNTFRDGYRILIALLAFFRDYRPLMLFTSVAFIFLLGALATGSVVVTEYVQTGQILRMPTAILSVGLVLLSAVSTIGGLLLSSINRRSAELAALIARR
jgi:glycosyltransferase involved in cell wall biosynthesis